MAPLDAIAQAAGRCNRNGLLPGLGIVRVFLPEDEGYPPGGYKEATSATAPSTASAARKDMDLQLPELFQEYYRRLYGLLRLEQEGEGGPQRAREGLHALGF